MFSTGRGARNTRGGQADYVTAALSSHRGDAMCRCEADQVDSAFDCEGEGHAVIPVAVTGFPGYR